MVIDIINKKDFEEVEMFLKTKGIDYLAQENEGKLLIHNEVLLRLEGEEDNHPNEVEQLESNIRSIVDTLYNENSDSIDETIESIAGRFIAHELY